MNSIEPINVPKWGLSMEEGTITEWLVSEGDILSAGQEIVEIETTKITNICEVHKSGTLRKIIGQVGETLSVGALIGVMAEDDVPDADIETFISSFETDNQDDDDAAVASLDIRSVGKERSLRVGVAGENHSTIPVVLIHGFGGDLENWSLVMAGLAVDRPVYSIEMPGHGHSSKSVGEGRLNDLAEAVTEVIEALELKSFVLGGHSLGGAVACHVSSVLAECVKGLILVAPAAMPGGTLSNEYIDGFLSARRTRDMKAPVSLLFEDQRMVTRDMLEQLVRFKRLDGAQVALEAIATKLREKDNEYGQIADKLTAYVGPITLINGQQDKVVGFPDERALPNSINIVSLENVGHMPHIEAYDKVISEIKELTGKI
jgi:pyruvate dehydrogenase E2 component (dihydrolipoamide acetyltransferase)